MNFLAHLHLAYLAKSSLFGNLVADFIRGDPYQQFESPIAEGIMMHRRLDVCVDHLPQVITAKHLFAKDVIRVAPITLDVMWDHFLALNWPQYCNGFTLTEFNEFACHQVSPLWKKLDDNLQSFHHYLWQEKWLVNYQDFEFIKYVIIKMAERRPKLYRLVDSIASLEHHYLQFSDIFTQFYPALMEQAKQKLRGCSRLADMLGYENEDNKL